MENSNSKKEKMIRSDSRMASNINPIEWLQKYLHKHILYSTYSEKSAGFQVACHNFFDSVKHH